MQVWVEKLFLRRVMNLDKHVAVITGAAQGIGFAVAQRLALAQALVVIVDANAEGVEEAAKKLRTIDTSAKAYTCDISDPVSVRSVFDTVFSIYKKIDILVNNAGVGGRFAPIQEQTDDDWRRVIEVDLTGVFLCCKAVIPHMISQSYGRIINVSSLAGKEGSPDMVPYSAAKAGVIGLTKALAREVAKHNIMVNVITPAIIETPLLKEMPHQKAQLLLERTPVGRFGRPEEVAAMVHWLASDDISYTTGAVFDLSGGRATY
jgi:NAD(P)-dependent dehydrogenase (short-subunit alcohol dehydrogenase family)